MLSSHAPNARQTHKGDWASAEESPSTSPSGCLCHGFCKANAQAEKKKGIKPILFSAYQTHKKPRQKQQGFY
jgi:hypothetical protein